MPMLMLFVIVILVLVAIPIGFSISKATNQSWAQAAKELGFRFQPPELFQPRRLEGNLASVRVVVDTYTVRRGKSNKTYTRFRASYPSLGLGLRLSEEGFLTGVTKWLGAQDISVGDNQFDASILVKGDHPQRVKQFLTGARRLRIRRFLAYHQGASIEDTRTTWSVAGTIRDSGRLVTSVRNIARVASCLITDEHDQTLQRAIDAQEQDRTADAVQILQTHRQASVDAQNLIDPDESVLEGELLYLADDRRGAAEVFSQVGDSPLADPEAQQWSRALSQPNPSPPEVSLPNSGAVDAMSVESVCVRLFESTTTSYQVTRIFEDDYQGREVRWQGRVDRAESYAYDMVLGSDPGCRLILEIHTLESAGYGDAKVKAIVRYPADAIDLLRPLKDQRVEFSARMLKVDGLLRKIYLAGLEDRPRAL